MAKNQETKYITSFGSKSDQVINQGKESTKFQKNMYMHVHPEIYILQIFYYDLEGDLYFDQETLTDGRVKTDVQYSTYGTPPVIELKVEEPNIHTSMDKIVNAMDLIDKLTPQILAVFPNYDIEKLKAEATANYTDTIYWNYETELNTPLSDNENTYPKLATEIMSEEFGQGLNAWVGYAKNQATTQNQSISEGEEYIYDENGVLIEDETNVVINPQ